MELKEVYAKYKDIIPYAVFGVLTTFINTVAYWLLAHPLKIEVMLSTVIAWVVAVLFAYVTNRKWVFHSGAHTIQEIMREMCSFFICRFATGVVDWIGMFLFVSILQGNDVIFKFAMNVVV